MREDVEKMVLYSNICLIRWNRTKQRLLNLQDMQGLVKNWIHKTLAQNWTNGNARMRKDWMRQYTKNISVIVSFCMNEPFIQSISVYDSVLSEYLNQIDYAELGKTARSQCDELVSQIPTSISDINFKVLEQIKFS